MFLSSVPLYHFITADGQPVPAALPGGHWSFGSSSGCMENLWVLGLEALERSIFAKGYLVLCFLKLLGATPHLFFLLVLNVECMVLLSQINCRLDGLKYHSFGGWKSKLVSLD